MYKFCPWCKDLGTKAKVDKLKEIEINQLEIAGLVYLVETNYKCSKCNCKFGEGRLENENRDNLGG